MKISLEWLGDFIKAPIDAHAAAEALTYGGFPVEAIDRVGDDTVLDVEVTSNRGDCLSHLGVARELAALMRLPFMEPAALAGESTTAGEKSLVTIEAGQLCPHYIARVIHNVKIGPSPAWLARRLEAVELRPINKVVDVTNYVLFELGQPLHAFDLNALHGGRIIVRLAKPGEKLTSLDGRERTLSPDMLVIADADRPVALAGVMGGLDTEVTARTVNVLLESARFDPLSVRKTARALAMRSDSSYRFERGLDPTLPERASRRAAQLIQEAAGGEAKAVTSAGASGWKPKTLALRLPRLKQVLGVELPTDDVTAALDRLHFSPNQGGDHIDVTVPSHRLDMNVEIDLVEEAARVVGYDKIPSRDEISIRVTPPDAAIRTIDAIRSTLVAAGYYEAVTFSFVSDLLAADFIPPGAKLPRAQANVRKADAQLRPSVLPGLLEAVRRNEAAGTPDARLFEIGSAFALSAENKLVEMRTLAFVGGAELREVRGVVETLLSQLDPRRSVNVVPAAHPGFGRAACGRIEWGGEAIGFLGKIDRAVAEKLSLRELPAAAELNLAPLLAGAQAVPQLQPLPAFPAVERDLSLVVPESLAYAEIEQVVRGLSLPSLEEVVYVTSYRGKSVGPDLKSATVKLIFRAADRTLTGEEVDAAVQKLIDAAKGRGWTLRT